MLLVIGNCNWWLQNKMTLFFLPSQNAIVVIKLQYEQYWNLVNLSECLYFCVLGIWCDKKYSRYRYKNVCLHYFLFSVKETFVLAIFQIFYLVLWLDIFGSSTINDGLIPPALNVYNFICGWGLFKTGDLFRT